MPELGPVTFPRDGSVLDGVRLSVDSDGHVALFGPNGAGKSTLLRGIAGTLPGAARRPDVAYLPQLAHLFRGTARSNLALGSGNAATAAVIAQQLGVSDVLDDDVRSLSVGQRQRIAIARVLSGDLPIVLLDEPLAPIDTADRRAVIGAIRRYTTGRMLVSVTHSATDAAALADELVIMDGGAITQRGAVAQVLSNPATPRIASIVGVTNVLDGVVTESGNGVSLVDVGGAQLVVATVLRVGEQAVVRVAPASIVVYVDEPHAGSHRTVIAGVVGSLQPVGELVEVHITEPVPLTALVTEGSVHASRLTEGRPVWLGIKAASVSVIWSG